MADGKKETPGISIEISPGEAYDRLAILRTKQGNVKDAAKRWQVRQEVERLREAMAACLSNRTAAELANRLYMGLIAIHDRLWDTENEVRECEAAQDFAAGFVLAARRVYQLNDQRSKIKSRIDEAYGFAPEVKEYASYDQEEKDQPCSSGCPHSGS